MLMRLKIWVDATVVGAEYIFVLVRTKIFWVVVIQDKGCGTAAQMNGLILMGAVDFEMGLLKTRILYL